MQNFLTKNLTLLKKKSPELHDQLQKLVPDEKFTISLSKSGIPTISIKGKDKIHKYISSKYDPVTEAKQLIDKSDTILQLKLNLEQMLLRLFFIIKL